MNQLIIIIIFSLATVSCSYLGLKSEEPTVDYTQSLNLAPLEVPPDLTSLDPSQSLQVPTIKASATQLQDKTIKTSEGIVVLPDIEGITLKSTGDLRWIEVNASAEQLWPVLREFWTEQGLVLKQENPLLGTMETEWAENRATLPKSDIQFLNRVMKAVYSTNTRDKYRLQLETFSPITTAIYISHQGLEEVSRERDGGGGFIWQNRPSDPTLEAELLRRLMIFLGLKDETANALIAANTPERSHIKSDEKGRLIIYVDDQLAQAWVRTGISLQRIGASLEEINELEKVYLAKVDNSDNPANRGNKVLFYTVRLEISNQGTKILVLDRKGDYHTKNEDFIKTLQKALL